MKPANSVEVGGRIFEFVPLSIGMVIKLSAMDFDQKFMTVDFEKLGKDKKAYAEFWRLWQDFCNSIFKRNLAWRLGFFPKELSFDSISALRVVEVTRAFFVYAGVIPPEHRKQEETSPDSRSSESTLNQSPATTT